MRAVEQTPDYRKTFRCKVDDARRQCELMVGPCVLPATLLDESAGGFSVRVERLEGLGMDQTAVLHTDSGSFAVRVIYVTESVRAEDDAAADEKTPQFRLGLSRLGETTLPEEPAISFLAGTLHSRLEQRQLSNGAPIAFGVLLALIAVAVPAAFMSLRWYTGPFKGQHPSPSTHRATESASPDRSRDAGSPFDDGDSAFGARKGRAQESVPFSPPSGQELPEIVRRLPGAAALALPEVIKQLQLTDDQQEQIRRRIEATMHAIRDLDRQSQGQQRQQIAERRRQLFDESRREALELLSQEQRAQWEKLTAEQ